MKRAAVALILAVFLGAAASATTHAGLQPGPLTITYDFIGGPDPLAAATASQRELFETVGAPAWREIARLQRLLAWADARRNQLFAPFAAMLLWGTRFALAVEAWRQRCGHELPGWLEAVGEREPPAQLSVRYELFFDQDPDHRGGRYQL